MVTWSVVAAVDWYNISRTHDRSVMNITANPLECMISSLFES